MGKTYGDKRKGHKEPVGLAVATNVTLATPGATLDGVTMSAAANKRVLLVGQTDPAENGVYEWVAAASPLVRPDDADTTEKVRHGQLVPVTGGTYAGALAILGPCATLDTSGIEVTIVSRDPADALDAGVVPAAYIDLTVVPTHGDTVTIGTDTYEFINTATGTIVTDDSYVAVAIVGGDAAATAAALLAAINGTADAEHATITLADTETPAIGVGSEVVAAVDLGTGNVIVYPSATQGDVMAGAASSPDMALDSSLTTTKKWSLANFNAGGGRASAQGRGVGRAVVAVTTQMIGAGQHTVGFAGLSPTGFQVQIVDSSGKVKPAQDDTFALVGNGLTVTFAGESGDLANGDTLHIVAWE